MKPNNCAPKNHRHAAPLPPKIKHPWTLYCCGILFLCFGTPVLFEYFRTGAVVDHKDKFTHYGQDAFVVALVPLVAGLIVLGVAIRKSTKLRKSAHKPDA
jgi:hypothetical protein